MIKYPKFVSELCIYRLLLSVSAGIEQ